ncbi:MAG: protein kinase [Holophagales bacterium]|nr:protein kinase [Holophagales bacterium]
METDAFAPLQELLAGRYRIDRELGRGGFATVYQIWNPRLERAEALKVLAPGHQADEDFSRRFTQEVRLAAALEHPSIVKVYDFGETRGIYWYSMQLVEGRTLSGEVRERGPLRERETARIAIPLLEALEYSHGRGIVHRDIKPENVILDRDGRPFLMDFGIAKSSGSLVKTQTGFLLGTPAYVAPEQAQGKKLDGRADLYALGVTLYKTVSGAYPFEAEDPLQAVILRLTQPPRPLGEARPGVDPGFAGIVMRALEREPDRRFPSARSMRDAMDAYLAGRPAETAATRVLGFGEVQDGAAPAPPPMSPDPTVLGPVTPQVPAHADTQAPRVVATSVLSAPSRRSYVVPMAAVFVILLFAVAGTGLVVLRTGGKPAEKPSAPRPTALPTHAQPEAAPTALPPSPTLVTTPATPPESAPAAVPEPTAATLRVLRPTRPPDPAPPPVRRAVTLPERLTPDPPFAGATPGGCSGAAVTVGFAIDPDGNVVAPRLFPSDAPPECGRFVMEALPRWKWRPAVDAAGAPALSARLMVYVQLP